MEKKKEWYKCLGIICALALSGGLFWSSCTENALAEDTPLENEASDPATIDENRECSLTLYKYDMSSARENNIEMDTDSLSYGEPNEELEKVFKDYAVEGVEFSYLYCGDIQTYTDGAEDAKEIEIICAVPEKLCDILDLEDSDAYQVEKESGAMYYSTDQIQTALENLLENGVAETPETEEDKNKLGKNVLEDYLNHHESTERMPLTDAEGRTTVSGLSAGLYLVVETKVPENVTETIDPWFLTLPFTADSDDRWEYDLTCYPKNQTGMPTLDKQVRGATEQSDGKKNTYADSATASEGETLEYICVSRLPHIQSRATWLTEYTFSDVLSEGLSYGKDVKIAFYASCEAACSNDLSHAVEQWGVPEDRKSMFVQEYGETGDDAAFSGTTMTISMTQKGLKQINENYSDYWMTVSYTATLHSDENVVLGDNGNPNEVTLLWRRTNNSRFDTLKDNCLVFTYGVDLKKQFSDGKGNPEKAEFLLKYKAEDQYLTACCLMDSNGEKNYYVNGYTDNKTEATRFIVSSGGNCQICGLRADNFELIEEKTDSRYRLLSNPVTFTLIQTETNESQNKSATAIVNDHATGLNNTGKLELQVINYRKVRIPQTGDHHLPIPYFLVMGFVVFGFFVFRKVRSK